MKKLITLIIAVAMIFTLAVSISAEEPTTPDDYIAYFSFDNADSGLKGGGAMALPNNHAMDGSAQVVIDTEEMWAGDGSLRLCNYDAATTYWLEAWKEDGSSLLTGLHDLTISFWSNSNGVGPSWTFMAVPRFDGQPFLQNYRSEYYIGLLENTSTIAQRFCVLGAEEGAAQDRTPELVGELTPNEWKHVAVTFDDTSYVLYVNGEWWGEYVLFDTTLVDILGDDSIFYIGASTWVNTIAGENFVNGYVDEFYVYPRCMTEEEVIDLYVAQGGEAPEGYYSEETEPEETEDVEDTADAPETNTPEVSDTEANTGDPQTEDEKGGCGSSIGAAAIAVMVSVLGCAVIKRR